jgi:hypothetical protein
MTVALHRPLGIVARASSHASPSAWDEQEEIVADGSVSRERAKGVRTAALDIVEMWGLHSFPASDPPANW